MARPRAAQRWSGWLARIALTRPAGGITATTNVIAGRLLLGPVETGQPLLALGLCCLASFCLYSGGMALNDLADRDKDLREGRARPIPRGLVTPRQALVLVLMLFGTGVVLAAAASGARGLVVALLLVGLIVLYDLVAKKLGLLGAAVMGACRGMNVILGAQLVAGAVPRGAAVVFEIGSVPVPSHAAVLTGFVFLLTAVSLFEGEFRSRLAFCLVGATLVASCFTPLFYSGPFALVLLVPVALGLGLAVWTAARRPSRSAVEMTVRQGVIYMPFLDAGALAGVSEWSGFIVVIGLFALARLLVRQVPVT